MTAIPFFDRTASADRALDGLRPLLDEILDSGVYVNGPQVQALEAEVAAYTGARFALGVSSGTSALSLALRALDLRPTDEVIVPAFSFVASGTAVMHAGATPVFADIEPDSYAIDVAVAEALVTERTRAIMPVHLFCQMADMDAVNELASRHGLAVVEDSAEGIGMRFGGRHAGLLGRIGVLSFFPTKTLGAFGDAGMVLTDDPALAEYVRLARYHGRAVDAGAKGPSASTVGHVLGTNARMDEVQAAVLRARLRDLPAEIARRAELARRYDARLARLAPDVRTPRIVRPEAGAPVFYVYLIEAERRDALMESLREAGVGMEQYYPRPIPRQPCFAHLPDHRRGFPVAERSAARTLALPLHPDMSDAMVDEVCARIEAFYARGV